MEMEMENKRAGIKIDFSFLNEKRAKILKTYVS